MFDAKEQETLPAGDHTVSTTLYVYENTSNSRGIVTVTRDDTRECSALVAAEHLRQHPMTKLNAYILASSVAEQARTSLGHHKSLCLASPEFA